MVSCRRPSVRHPTPAPRDVQACHRPAQAEPRVAVRTALWDLRRIDADSNTETEIAFTAFVDQEFAKADRNMDAKLDFKEFCSCYVTVAASMKT